MIAEIKEKKLTGLLEEIKKRNKKNKVERKSLAKHYGSLIRGLDGLDYQKAVRYGTDD